MQPRVTAILVARNGAQHLERTLASLVRQTRRLDALVVVDAGSTDGSKDLLAAAGPTHFITDNGRVSFGQAVANAVHVAAPEPAADDWLWLLTHDNAAHPRTLAALLGAVEIAPSVAVAGPKLMRLDEADVIASYGETLTPFGSSIALVDGELDQAQHDRNSDLLAIAASGMLVRRSVFSALGGFDPALPSVDAALDFCIRVRLAGHRIVGVPSARVATTGGPETFGRRVSASTTHRLRRAAQLHRRLTYAPALAVPLHWLSILPLAIVRAVWQLLAKRPGSVGAEFRAAASAIVDRRVGPSRRNLSRNRALGWAAIAPLRMPWGQVRELRAHQRDLRQVPVYDSTARTRPSFFSSGGAWIMLLLAAIGVVAFGGFLGATALSGGGLAPLSSTVAELWNNVGYGWRDIGAGFLGAADPFAAVLAVLGSLTFWAPSLSIVALYLVALPLASLAAWWCAARFSQRGWAPAIAAVLWALAPPFLSALSTGHLGAALAHLLLPWLVVALFGSARSWSASAAATLLFAVIAASAPSLIPVLVLGWLAWLVTHPTSIHRVVGVPIGAIVLFLPLVAQQVAAGNALGLLADPGVPFLSGTDSGVQLALAAADGGSNGWIAIAKALGLSEVSGSVIFAALMVPFALFALLALFLPGSRRAVPSLVLALAGFATAVASAHLAVAAVGSESAMVWPGSGLSVFWLGLVGAVVFCLEALGRRVALPAMAIAITFAVAAFPVVLSVPLGTADVRASSGRLLPAFVTAEAATNPQIGTLELVAQEDGGLAAVLTRGAGSTLDDQSTVMSTTQTATDEQRQLATLAGNLSSQSGFDAAAALNKLQVEFIVSPAAESGAALEIRERAGESLDANPVLTAVGSTDNGYLWHFEGIERQALPAQPGPMGTTIGTIITIAQLLVFGVALLLAIPTSRRVRSRSVASNDEPADTFDEVDND